MQALRRYLSHYCQCDDETVARYVAAEKVGVPLQLPGLASFARMNSTIAEWAASLAAEIEQERGERAAATTTAANPAPAPVPPQRAKVLAPKHQPGSAASKRHDEIMSSWAARLRPERAAQLAEDRTISADAAFRILFNSLTRSEVHAHNIATAPADMNFDFLTATTVPVPEAAGGFGPSFDASPRSAAEKAAADVEQFRAIARAISAGEGQGGHVIRMHV